MKVSRDFFSVAAQVQSEERIPALDIARGFASLAVVIFHYCYVNGTFRNKNEFFSNFSVYGYLGVHFFFVLSGFVIFMTLSRSRGALDFALARVARLYPAYALSIILTVAAVAALGLGQGVDWMAVALNFTMFADVFGVEHVNPAYWTLGREVIFYILVSGALLLAGQRAVLPFMIIWLALSLLHAVMGLNALERILILKWTPFFVGGASLYLAARGPRARRGLYWAVFASTIPLSVYYALIGLENNRKFFAYFSASPVVVSLIILLIYLVMILLVFRPCLAAKVPVRVVEVVGGGSYLLYLIHERVGMILVHRLYPVMGLASVIGVIFVMLVISGLLYWWFDRPVQRHLKQWRKSAILLSERLSLRKAA